MKNIQTRVMLSAVLIMSAVLTSSAAPGSEAQFDRLVKAYVLNPDGSQEIRVQKQLTIYTHAAMNNLYGETFIVYDPACQHLKINESYTRQVDGTIIETPANAFVEVLPSAAANAPAYNGLREMVVVHTGLELGATIYLDYTLTTDAGALPALDIFEQVEELSPIKYYELSVSVPSGTICREEASAGIRTVSPWRTGVRLPLSSMISPLPAVQMRMRKESSPERSFVKGRSRSRRDVVKYLHDTRTVSLSFSGV